MGGGKEIPANRANVTQYACHGETGYLSGLHATRMGPKTERKAKNRTRGRVKYEPLHSLVPFAIATARMNRQKAEVRRGCSRSREWRSVHCSVNFVFRATILPMGTSA